jgi:formylglycine-generating enzyme required for sulfatase activity
MPAGRACGPRRLRDISDRCARILAVLMAATALAIPTCGPAAAASRVALVLGNGAYQNAALLPNPAHDAADIARTLRQVGFDVTEGIDLDRRAMVERIRAFSRKLDHTEVALFFYSGHGLQVSGRNYLVPVDAKLERPGDLEFEMIDLGQVLQQMSDEARVNLVFLDACRDNPLGRSLARNLGTRSLTVGAGLGSVQSTVGTMIAYATQPDNVALDGDGRNSPFTTALLKHLPTPGLEIGTMMRRVRVDVMAATRGKQVPWDHSSLTGDVVLAALPPGVSSPVGPATPAPAAALSPATTASPAVPAPAAPSEADQAWAVVRDTKDPAALERFLARYDDSTYAALARARLDKLKQQNVAFLPVTPPPDQARPREAFKDCATCPEMIVMRAGRFVMGSPTTEPSRSGAEEPIHDVTIARPFAVGRFAVTFAEWDACVADGGCNRYRPLDEGWERGRRPVINISWDDAHSYVAWLSLRTGRTYRLPSEAEREYVTRAGTRTPFWWGATLSTAQANYDGSYGYDGGPSGENRQKTVKVDTFEANPWGLYQVHGNVWEWVEDCWQPDYRSAPADGRPVTGDCRRRVLRGGSWVDSPWFLRSAFRKGDNASTRDQSIGFRVAAELGR